MPTIAAIGGTRNFAPECRPMARILIVDDSEASLTLISRELERVGFAVTTALGAAEALDCARAEPPDLILLDGVMPDMDGFETCERLKCDPDLATIPVLMWTALDAPGDVVRGLETCSTRGSAPHCAASTTTTRWSRSTSTSSTRAPRRATP